jgi:alkanesulfonate monooxygenase SsuD/methylene tetrahydromethanopterin reductase-like flavin-dependent oxidoreductase (luciferase family)
VITSFCMSYKFAVRAILQVIATKAGRQMFPVSQHRLEPPPLGQLPLLIGGSGQKVTLRLVAEHAGLWNSFGPPAEYAAQNAG